MSKPIKWAELNPTMRNALVAEKVMNWQEKPCDGEVVEQGVYWSCSRCGLSGNWSGSDFDRFSGHVELPPKYTTSMDAAWLVMKQVNSDYGKYDIEKFLCDIATSYDAYSDHYGGDEAIFSLDDLANLTPEIICIAALRSCGVLVDIGK